MAATMDTIPIAHAVLLEPSIFHSVLEHIAPSDIPSCLQVCTQWNSCIRLYCTSESSISISRGSSLEENNQMKQKISSFVSEHSTKKYNFKMTIAATQLHINSQLFLQLVPNFASTLNKLQLSLKSTTFGGFDDEVSLKNLLGTLTSLMELELDLPFYACSYHAEGRYIRSAFDVVLTPPFVMPTLRKLTWREPLVLHKSDCLPVAFPSLTVCVLSLVKASDYTESSFADRILEIFNPNPLQPSLDRPLNISWPSLKKLTVEGYEGLQPDFPFQWLGNISPLAELTHVSLLNVEFRDTTKHSAFYSQFFRLHSLHLTELKLTRSNYLDEFRYTGKDCQDFLESCDFPSLKTLECDVTFIGNVSTTVTKMPSLRELHVVDSNLQPVQFVREHDDSMSCEFCQDLWKEVFPVENEVKRFVLQGNYCVKSLNKFGTIFRRLETLEIDENPEHSHIILENFAHVKNVTFLFDNFSNSE